MSQDQEALVGTPYRTVGLLGQGGMGVVYEAEHKALKKRVVVKLLHERYSSQPHLVDRLRLEAQALAGLSSQHLVQVHDLGETAAGRPFFVMEMLAGRTLAQRLAAEGAMSVVETVELVRQLLRGLAVAHSAGIVHRDIKPENIFLCERRGEPPLVKILDFGIAKVLETNNEGGPAPLAFPTEEGAVLGTPRYLSPEQAKGYKVDLRADLYSVGLVMFAMLTGARPFEGVRDYLDLVRAHAEEPPVAPSKVATQPIPPEIDEAALKAMQKDPAQRYPSALAFEQAIARAMRSTTARSTDPPFSHRAPAKPVATVRLAEADPKRPTPIPRSSPTPPTAIPPAPAYSPAPAHAHSPAPAPAHAPAHSPAPARPSDPPSSSAPLPLTAPRRISGALAFVALLLVLCAAAALTVVAHAAWSGS